MNEKNNKNSVKIDQFIARRIIETVGSNGTPPEYGFQFFTVGLNEYLNIIEKEYLETFIRQGGSTFKMIVGAYGGGKTHFLYNIRELAWKYNYITAYITLRPNETPFHRLEQIYKAIVANLIYYQSPQSLLSSYDIGIEAVIKTWFFKMHKEFSNLVSDNAVKPELERYVDSLRNYDSISFHNAIKEAFLSLAKGEDEDLNLILQWLLGESINKPLVKKFRIFEKIDKTTAFKMIRSLIQWIKDIGYSEFLNHIIFGYITESYW